MAPSWEGLLSRWVEAGLVDPATAESIGAWERSQAPAGRLSAPVRVALALGAVLLAAGVLLFVSAHWESLAPGPRFALVLAAVAGLHSLAALAAPGFPSLAVALHGVGSVALGAGVFLAGQIFHIEASWPQGVLLWALGAGIGWGLLRQWPQLALLALLVPAWLAGEWGQACERALNGSLSGEAAAATVGTAGLFLTSLAFFTCPAAAHTTPERRVLLWVGGLTLLPTALAWALASNVLGTEGRAIPLPAWLSVLGWTGALGGPVLLAWCLRRHGFWPLGVAIGWMLVDLVVPSGSPTLFDYAWWALGGVLLVFWGVADTRAERINMGAAITALTVIAFYFAQVMDRLGRSASLIGLGVLFLGGGWLLERLRRRLVARIRDPLATGDPG